MNCHDLLKRMGITPNYIGFHQTLSAVTLVRNQPDLLFSVTKNLYPAVAEEYGTTWKAVERNIRFVISLSWSRNPSLLQELAGYPITEKPKAAQFISILADPHFE